MVAIKNLLLFISAASAAVLPRTVAQVEADLMTIDGDTKNLTTAVNAFTGDTNGAVAIQNLENKLETDLKQANKDAAGSTPSENDAQTIINYINNTLEPDVSKALTALENKKSQFASAGFTSVVQSDLANLKNETDTLGKTLISLAPQDKKSAAQASLNKLDSDFQGAINYFAS